MQIINQIISSIDIYATKFEFKYRAKQTYKTVFGSFLTLIFFFLTGLSVYTFVSGYMDTENPQVTVSLESAQEYSAMSLADEGISFSLMLFNGTHFFNSTTLSRYVTLKALITRFDVHNVTGEGLLNQTLADIVECDKIEEEFRQPSLEEAYKSGNLNHYYSQSYCPKLRAEHWTLQGSATKPPYNYVSLLILPCSLADTRECANLKELSVTYAFINYVSKSLNFTEKLKSVKSILDTDTQVLLNPSASNNKMFYFKENIVLDDDQDYRDPHTSNRFINVEKILSTSGARDGSTSCTPQQIKDVICFPYVIVDLKYGGKISRIHRKYEKLFATISEIGGFGDLIYIALGILYLVYNRFVYERWLRGQIIPKEFQNTINSTSPLKKMIGGNKQAEKMLDDWVDDQLNGIDLIKKVQRISLLSDIFCDVLLEDYHKDLAPYAMLRFIEKKADQREHRPSSKKITKGSKISSIYDLDKQHGSLLSLGSKKLPDSGPISEERSFLNRGGSGGAEDLGARFENSLIRLKSSRPKDELSKSLKKYFIENLGIFEGSYGGDKEKQFGNGVTSEGFNGLPSSGTRTPLNYASRFTALEDLADKKD